MKERSFKIELRDLNSSDFWTNATVYYEQLNGEPEAIVDVSGKIYSLNDLSEFDRERVMKDLVFNLSADNAYSPECDICPACGEHAGFDEHGSECCGVKPYNVDYEPMED